MTNNKSNIFQKKYSDSYDSLYYDKNYPKEVDYLLKVFSRYGLKGKKILDLGCGTGTHAIILAKRGYNVVGIDRSSEMIKHAREKAKKDNVKNVKFISADIRNIKLDYKFDAVISMFAVMGYMNESEDLVKVFRTAKKLLNKKGLFLFDIWNGFAVLEDRPKYKIKKVKEKDETMIRVTKPKMDWLNNAVDINFELFRAVNKRLIRVAGENHRMRFFFPQEIFYFMKASGFSKIELRPFLKLKGNLKENDWNMTVIGQL